MNTVILRSLMVSGVLSLVFTADASANSYTVTPYAHYFSNSMPRRMVMDDSGNVYVGHSDNGLIMKISTFGQADVFVTGHGSIRDLTWGGGTAYGNYLYAANRVASYYDEVLQIDLDGNVSSFASMEPPRHSVTLVDIDRTGNYGGMMFSGASGQDRLYTVSNTGGVTLFADWPGYTDGGGPLGIGFDVTGNYGGKMYVANTFTPDNAHLSGVFMMNPDTTVSRFADAIVAATQIDFDATGLYFDHDMFVIGRTEHDALNSLWRVGTDGAVEEFMAGVNYFTFGTDGAMYVSAYDWNTQTVDIVRVVPEPAALLLIAAGSLCLRKRRR